MNKGELQSLLVQRMMVEEAHGWRSMSYMIRQADDGASSTYNFSRHNPSLFAQPSNASLCPMTSWQDNNEESLDSWSQLLGGGWIGEDDGYNAINLCQSKKRGWENHLAYEDDPVSANNAQFMVGIKHDNYYVYNYDGFGRDEGAVIQAPKAASWSQTIAASSPRSSCVTSSLSGNILEFTAASEGRRNLTENSFECISKATGALLKKAKMDISSSTHSSAKARKEKVGDKIGALHQLVCPFGKTDTASVLLEVIGYIRFLHSQIEVLSSSYLNSSACDKFSRQDHQLPVHGDEGTNCTFPEEYGQKELSKDLKSKGLCLVPVSCTQLGVASDNVAVCWEAVTNGFFGQ